MPTPSRPRAAGSSERGRVFAGRVPPRSLRWVRPRSDARRRRRSYHEAMVRIPAASRPPLLDAALAAALTTGAVLLGMTGTQIEKQRGAFPDAATYHRALLYWWLFTALIITALM